MPTTPDPPTPTRGSFGSFIGRARELRALAEWLRSPSRLVTVLGPPGIGKTRLVQHFVRGIAASASCDLTLARDQADVVRHVAYALGLTAFEHAAPTPEALVEALASRPGLLLVLDNVEHVTAALGHTVAVWLDRVPSLRVLSTSRAALELPGEELLPVASLSDDEAMDLFIERAKERCHGFQVPAGARDTLRELVRRVDRLPLAIELVAPRVRTTSLTRLLEGLTCDDDARTTDGGRASRPSPLHVALEGSWRSLDSDPRAAMSALAVFDGTFTIESAAAVCGDSRASVEASVDALVNRSFVHRLEPSPDHDEPRFGIYLFIRDFARLRVKEAGDERSGRDRHAEFFGQWGVARLRASTEREERAPLAELLVEEPNLLQAFHHVETTRPEVAAGLALVLDVIAQAHGPLSDSVERLHRALGRLDVAGHGELASQVLRAAGVSRFYLGEFSRAVEDLRACRTLLERAGRADALEELNALEALMQQWLGQGSASPQVEPSQGNVRMFLGVLLIAQGRPDEAAEHLELAREEARRVDGRAYARLTLILGLALHELGDVASAERLFEEGYARCAEAGDSYFREAARLWRAHVKAEQGDLAAAVDQLDEARRAFSAMGDRFFLAGTIGYAGVYKALLGADTEGFARLEEALARCREAQDFYRGVVFLTFLVALRAARGEERGVDAMWDESATLARAARNPNLAALHAVLRTTVDLREARDALAAGRDEVHRAALARARAGVAAHASGVVCSTDVRLALRWVAHWERTWGLHGPNELPPTSTLKVGPGAEWFQVDDGEVVKLSTRRTLQRLLDALTRDEGATRRAWTVEALLGEGWPGQRVQRDAGNARVFVAVHELRKRGLRDVLVRDAEGYRIAQGVSVVRV